jgi:hypothetical protein
MSDELPAEPTAGPSGEPDSDPGPQQIIEDLLAQGVLDQSRIEHLERGILSGRRIGTAIGILMALRHLTDEQAFDVLRTESQNSQRKLREVAEDVIRTGEVGAR